MNERIKELKEGSVWNTDFPVRHGCASLELTAAVISCIRLTYNKIMGTMERETFVFSDVSH